MRGNFALRGNAMCVFFKYATYATALFCAIRKVMPMATPAPPSRERAVYTLRLGNAERRLLEAAAAQKREYLAEYVRRTALDAARRDLVGAR